MTMFCAVFAAVDWTASATFWVTLLAAVVAVAATAINYYVFRAQVDPHVIIYATADHRRPSIIVLVIENIGRQLAKDVRFKTSKPLPFQAWGIGFDEARVPDVMTEGPIINGIPALAPGSKRVITWGQFGGLKKYLGTEIIRVNVQFRGDGPFGETIEHNVECLLDIESFAINDASDHNWDQKLAKAAERIANHLEQQARL